MTFVLLFSAFSPSDLPDIWMENMQCLGGLYSVCMCAHVYVCVCVCGMFLFFSCGVQNSGCTTCGVDIVWVCGGGGGGGGEGGGNG